MQANEFYYTAGDSMQANEFYHTAGALQANLTEARVHSNTEALVHLFKAARCVLL